MNPRLIPSFALLALWIAAGSTNGVANIGDGSPVAPAGAPRSTFVSEPYEPGFGKDPFHPRTTRFNPKAPQTQEERPVEPVIPDSIALRGISVVGLKKLAIINTSTVAEGEEVTARINGKVVKITCVEIKEKSAVISVNGATKELPLRASFQ